MYVLENFLAIRLGTIYSHGKYILSHIDASSQKNMRICQEMFKK